MADGQVHVTFSIDTLQLTRAMRRAAIAASRFQWALFLGRKQHQLQHHRREDPAGSAMHTAYDRRRRARRRKKR